MGLAELLESHSMDALHACDIVHCLEWAASGACVYVLPVAWQWRRRDCPARSISRQFRCQKKKFHSHVIIDESYLLWPIAADRLRSATATLAYFRISCCMTAP